MEGVERAEGQIGEGERVILSLQRPLQASDWRVL